ncbi:GNAT family N-acetyltransferase [Streptomyces arenae]|uniref:GNAT family N-acetyltransferase n=1 Tax=Streptomyces arenae TaxID=29301 RepID=UPI002659B7B5|nr:GNAT family protein [Streptomyces arenae]MCG7210618.1 GNAT family N-acetyltransferase [Streptomyces arenae]
METARLVLRRFGPQDAPALAAYRSDPEVSRYQSWERPVPLAAAERLVAGFAAGDPRTPGWFQYAVQLRDAPGLIGDIGVRRAEDGRQAELGFTFDPAFQGRGYATEAVTRVARSLLLEKGLHRLSANCDSRNVPSARLLERVGFRREGHLRQSTWMKGEWTDDLLYGLLASEYRP